MLATFPAPPLQVPGHITRLTEAALCCCTVCPCIKARLNMAMPPAPYTLDVFSGKPRTLQEAGHSKAGDTWQNGGDSGRRAAGSEKGCSTTTADMRPPEGMEMMQAETPSRLHSSSSPYLHKGAAPDVSTGRRPGRAESLLNQDKQGSMHTSTGSSRADASGQQEKERETSNSKVCLRPVSAGSGASSSSTTSAQHSLSTTSTHHVQLAPQGSRNSGNPGRGAVSLYLQMGSHLHNGKGVTAGGCKTAGVLPVLCILLNCCYTLVLRHRCLWGCATCECQQVINMSAAAPGRTAGLRGSAGRHLRRRFGVRPFVKRSDLGFCLEVSALSTQPSLCTSTPWSELNPWFTTLQQA
jgi:hypothetical protein